MPIWLRSRALKQRPVRHAELRWRAEAMLAFLDRPEAELSILLCDDETIQELNREYRNKNRPTDVLAFPMHEGEGPQPNPDLLGDVVISLPTATLQAAERDRPIIDEVTFLLAHGLLHLLGYDHATKGEEREMTARTEALMAVVEAAR